MAFSAKHLAEKLQILIVRSLLLCTYKFAPLPFFWKQVIFTFWKSRDKQTQPTALILGWQQDSGSSHSLRTVPDGIGLSQCSPLGLGQSAHGRHRELLCPLHPWLPCHQIMNVTTSRSNSKHLRRVLHRFLATMQKHKGSASVWFKLFSRLYRTTLADTGHLSVFPFYSRYVSCHCLRLPSISSKIVHKSISNFRPYCNHKSKKNAPFVWKIHSMCIPKNSLKNKRNKKPQEEPDDTIFLIKGDSEKHRQVKLLSLHYFYCFKWIEEQ